MKVDVWHNIMWSKYKAAVFSELSALGNGSSLNIAFTQIAATMQDRVGLTDIDWLAHKYEYQLLFNKSYNKIRKIDLYRAVTIATLKTDADLVILAGYDRLEYWIQALILSSRHKKFAIFCDSTIYDRHQGFVKGLLKRLFFSLCSGAFCYGERSREYLVHYGMPKEQIFLRCQAAWLPDSYKRSLIPAIKIKALSEAAARRILYVGRLAAEKDVSTLIFAFRLLLDDGHAARLVIVGSGPEQAAIKALVSELNISDYVEFKGPLFGDKLYEEYIAASCFVLPSRSEPWGLVVNEALSFGCPVIVSTRCGCLPELVEEGISGYSFDCGDRKGLARQIEKTLENMPVSAANITRILDKISDYTPGRAAEAILHGIWKILLAK